MELSYSMDVVARFEQLRNHIFELEEAIFIEEDGLSFTQKKKDFTRWEEDWDAWCRELLLLQEAKWNEAILGIYGDPVNLKWLVRLYLKILGEAGYSVRARYRWFDESLVTEEQPYQKEPLNLDTMKTHVQPIGIELIVREIWLTHTCGMKAGAHNGEP